MQNEMPTWVVILSALATPTLASFAIYIAWRQHQTAKEKIKVDLFDRRFALFQTVEKSILNVLQHRKANDEIIRLMATASLQAPMLFPKVMAKKIEDWRITFININITDINARNHEMSQEFRQSAISKQLELLKTLSSEYERLGDLFAPCMRPIH
jgi:hypothetical protein